MSILDSPLAKMNHDEFAAYFMALSPDDQIAVSTIAARQAAILRDPTPGALAMRLDPLTVQTPALEIIDQHLVGVRDALATMYERRTRFAELVNKGTDKKLAIEQVSQEIEQRGITRLILSMSPQEGKSSRGSRYAPEWYLQQFPQLRIGLISYDGVNAGQFSYQIRADIELFNGLNGNHDLGLRLQRDEKAKGRWLLTTGGGVFAIGVGGGLTGRPLDLGLLDDVLKDYRAADSLLLSEQTWDWYQTVFRPRLAPWAPIVITMTRWHELDLAGRLQRKQEEDDASGLKNFDKWTVVNIPAQADHDPSKGETDILGRKPGEFMISARGRTQADWETIKNATSARFWSALYQGRPAPTTGTIFLAPWWRYYESVLWTQMPDGSFLLNGYDVTQSWDLTFGDSANADFVVGLVWAKKRSDSFLITQLRARLDFPSTIDAMRRMYRLFPQSRRKLVEAKANGDAAIATLKHEIPGIIPIKPRESKTDRADAVSPFVRSGNFYLPSREVALSHPDLAFSVDDFVLEATSFPNGGHDDQVDAFTQYAKETYVRGGRGRLQVPSQSVRTNPRRPERPKTKSVLSPVQEQLTRRARGVT